MDEIQQVLSSVSLFLLLFHTHIWETKLFHFHRMFKKGGGASTEPPEPPLDLPLKGVVYVHRQSGPCHFPTFVPRLKKCFKRNSYKSSTHFLFIVLFFVCVIFIIIFYLFIYFMEREILKNKYIIFMSPCTSKYICGRSHSNLQS